MSLTRSEFRRHRVPLAVENTRRYEVVVEVKRDIGVCVRKARARPKKVARRLTSVLRHQDRQKELRDAGVSFEPRSLVLERGKEFILRPVCDIAADTSELLFLCPPENLRSLRVARPVAAVAVPSEKREIAVPHTQDAPFVPFRTFGTLDAYAELVFERLNDTPSELPLTPSAFRDTEPQRTRHSITSARADQQIRCLPYYDYGPTPFIVPDTFTQ